MEKLKAEIFDIIVKQDLMKLEYRQLEKQKEKKLKELEGLEKDK